MNGAWQPRDPEALVRAYEAGATLAALGREHGVHPNTISSALLRLGVPSRRKPTWEPSDPAALIARYQAGESLDTLGRVYGVSPTAISRALWRHGARTRDPVWEPPDVSEFVRRYEAGVPLYELAERYGVTTKAITTAIRRHVTTGALAGEDGIGQLRLPGRVERALVAGGVTRITQIQALTGQQWFRLRGVGPDARRQIETAIQERANRDSAVATSGRTAATSPKLPVQPDRNERTRG